MPFFTVVTPVLNRLADIQKMIQCVKSQDFDDYELLIVDNGSTDGTYEYCQSQAFSKISVLQCPERGLAFARNVGIRAAQGKWIVLLDSDNLLFRASTLREIKDSLEKDPGLLGLFSFCEDDRGKLISSCSKPGVKLSFADYICEVSGELAPTVRADWFKEHLYPEIRGSVTEFPLCVWFPLVMTGKVRVMDQITQVYGTSSDGRICSNEVGDSRARELSHYYFMLLDRFGDEIRRVNSRLYLSYVAKLVLYNRLSGAYTASQVARWTNLLTAKVVDVLPKSLFKWSIEQFKAHRNG